MYVCVRCKSSCGVDDGDVAFARRTKIHSPKLYDDAGKSSERRRRVEEQGYPKVDDSKVIRDRSKRKFSSARKFRIFLERATADSSEGFSETDANGACAIIIVIVVVVVVVTLIFGSARETRVSLRVVSTSR